MTSKNLYFKLMKADFKSRIWALALIGLTFFFRFPITAAIRAGFIDQALDYEYAVLRYARQMQELVSFSSGVTAFWMITIALICGMSSFSYLNSKSKVDFYHGIPVRRETLYAANYINGILIMAVPYALMLVLGVVLAVANGANAAVMWQTAGQAFWLNLIYYVLMYSTVIIAVMMTGNLVVSFLGVVVFCSIIPITIALVMAYFSEFFDTFLYWSFEGKMEWGIRLSPLTEYTRQVSEYYQRLDPTGTGQVQGMAVAVALLVSIILAAAGGFLYKKRPSEAAGRAMAFGISRPVIRIVITMVSSLGMGLFFWSVQSKTGWAIFGILCGGIIAHCVIEIIYHFDFKKLFSDKWQLVGCLAVSVLILCIFRYDVFGYDRYIPKENQVKEAAVSISALNNWTSYGETVQRRDGSYGWESIGSEKYAFDHMREMDVRKVLVRAEKGIAEAEIREADRVNYRWGNGSNMTIQYRLNNGRKVNRSYHISLEANEALVEALYAEPGFKENIYPVMNLSPEQVAEVRYREIQPETRLNKLTPDEKAELLLAYQQDFQSLTIARMRKEMPVGLIRFMKSQDVAGLSWAGQQKSDYNDYSYNEERDFYPVYPSFTNTNRVLEKYGITPGDDLTETSIREIVVECDIQPDTDERYAYKEQSKYISIQEEQEIKELLAILENQNIGYYNDLYKAEPGYYANIVYQNEDGYTTWLFPENQVPEFVKTRLTNP